MTFLPIVERELRAAARRRGTYRVRWWVAVIAMIISLAGAATNMVLPRGGANPGSPLFTFLTSYAFGVALLAGVLLTADCLSQEKREGTMGLLFLTDLKGYDVVLGKFAAMSLNAIYGLLAMLPAMAIPLLLGGVTGGEFWRMAVALLNALFFSLAAGICVSAYMRQPLQAMGNTLALLALVVGGLPALVGLASMWAPLQRWSWLAWFSPFCPISAATDARYVGQAGRFWGGLGLSHLGGWLFLALASWRLPRAWQEPVIGQASKRPASFRRSLSSLGRRGRLGSQNPVQWLMGNAAGVRSLAWLIVCGWGVIAVLSSVVWPEAAMLSYRGARFFAFLIKILFVFEACRFFAEGRRDGMLELLLCTPLSTADIIKGQWLALGRTFLWPLVTLALLSLAPLGFGLVASGRLTGWSPVPWSGVFGLGIGLVTMGWFMLTLVADLLAAGWFGMWLALTVKKPNLAGAMTVLWVLILPSFLCGLDVMADVAFIVWGATRLRQDLRRFLDRQAYRAEPFMASVNRAAGCPPRR